MLTFQSIMLPKNFFYIDDISRIDLLNTIDYSQETTKLIDKKYQQPIISTISDGQFQLKKLYKQ